MARQCRQRVPRGRYHASGRGAATAGAYAAAQVRALLEHETTTAHGPVLSLLASLRGDDGEPGDALGAWTLVEPIGQASDLRVRSWAQAHEYRRLRHARHDTLITSPFGTTA
jgi:hypothetical protein